MKTKTRLVFAAAVALLLPSIACDSGPKTYQVSFICETSGGADCPVGNACPVVPVGPNACGDLPGLFGHAAMPIDMARPIGCTVGLPYGDPYSGDSQQSCTCLMMDASAPAAWWCPI